MTVGFVTALAWEQQLLRRSLPDHCLVELSGMGATAAAAAAERLLQRGADLLVSSGCCAGLDARLRCGDIVLADQICNETGQTVRCGGDHLAMFVATWPQCFARCKNHPPALIRASMPVPTKQPAVIML